MFSTSNIIGSFVFDSKGIVEESLLDDSSILDHHQSLERGEIPDPEAALSKKHGAKPADPAAIRRFAALIRGKHKERFHRANFIITKEKIRESVRKDTLLIQAINNIDEIDKTANLLAKRLREWYELYNPEVSRAMPDHESFVRAILSRSKDDLKKEFSVERTMGADLPDADVAPILELARKIDVLYSLREEEKKYVESLMKQSFPNIGALAGPQIGAKLIAQAGGILRLSEFPASTIQILGAEKALFRHMKTGARPPKYGILINHPLVTKAGKEDKGRVARTLANKLSIAAKVDHFGGEFVGDRLREELEKKLKK